MPHPTTAPKLAPASQPGEGLSLVIPICGGLELTRGCFASILQSRQQTGLPRELIFVDNGSRDGSREWLKGLQARFDWVRVETRDRNLGFAGGCNAGLRAARGATLAILNNDTLVETRLLQKLLTALDEDPRTGLVAPVSNYVMGSQQVQLLPTESQDDVEAIADRLEREAPGKRSEVEHLAGLCLLGRRAFFEQTGLFDPVYGLGNYEDNDLCLRARIADHRLIVVHDAYVHHFGNRSFRDLGIDYESQLESQRRLHRQRWQGCLLFELEEAVLADDHASILELSEHLPPDAPGRDWCLRIRAKALVDSGRQEEARRLYTEFCERHPLHTESACLLAFCHLDNDDVERGRQLLARALRECHMDDGFAASVLARLAHWCWTRSLRAEAHQHLAAARKIRPGALSTTIVESGFLLEEERYDEVLSVLTPLRHEAHTDILANLGIAHFHKGDLEQAIADFEEGARLGGPGSAAAANLAQVRALA